MADRLSKCILAGVAAFGIGMIVWAEVAEAQQQRCSPFAQMRDHLKERYNESNAGGGIVNEKSVAVLFRSPGGETWTLAILDMNGMACAVASGTGWAQSEIEKGQPS